MKVTTLSDLVKKRELLRAEVRRLTKIIAARKARAKPVYAKDTGPESPAARELRLTMERMKRNKWAYTNPK